MRSRIATHFIGVHLHASEKFSSFLVKDAEGILMHFALFYALGSLKGLDFNAFVVLVHLS